MSICTAAQQCLALVLNTPQLPHINANIQQPCTEVLFTWYGGQSPYTLTIIQAVSGSLVPAGYTAAADLQETSYTWAAAAVPGSYLHVSVQDALNDTVDARYAAVIGGDGCLRSDVFASAATPTVTSDSTVMAPSSLVAASPSTPASVWSQELSTSLYSSTSYSLPSSLTSLIVTPSVSPILFSFPAASATSILTSSVHTSSINSTLIAGITVLGTVAVAFLLLAILLCRRRARRTKRLTAAPLERPVAFDAKDSPLPRTPLVVDTAHDQIEEQPAMSGGFAVPSSCSLKHVHPLGMQAPSQAELSAATSLTLRSEYAHLAAGPQMREVDGGIRFMSVGATFSPIWDVEVGALPPAYEDRWRNVAGV